MRLYVRSLTAALDIDGLSGQVPETIVSGKTADILPFAAFKWYQWIMYRDATASFPEDKMVLGRNLGPAINVGPAMTQKVLESNGQTIYWSTIYWSTVPALTDDKMSNKDKKRQQQVFHSNVQSFLGAAITPKEMASDPDMVDANTPSFNLYEDDNDGPQDHILDKDDADPDTYDQYMGAEVELLQGDRILTGKVKRRKTNPDGLVHRKANSNPILDSRTYDVEFPNGQMVK
jgi:hypothetical protein